MFKPKRGKSTILYIEERPLILWLLPLVNIINSLFRFDCLPAFSDHITFQLCKTEKGERYVHMKEDGADCFRRIIQNRKHPKIEPMIDGYSGFLFLDKNDMPMVVLHWEKHFQHIREKYNSIYKVQMSSITPHVCRHTFCSNMAKSGMNPKTLQYIRGHSDIGVTLNTYTHLQFEDALEEMKKVVD